MIKISTLLLTILLLSVSACSGKLVKVKPFQKEAFSQDKMLLTPMKARTHYEEHIFSIREASQGGNSSFQGGCACK